MVTIKQMVGLGRPISLQNVNTYHGNAVYQGGGTVRMKRRPLQRLAIFGSLASAVTACGSSSKSSTAPTTASTAAAASASTAATATATTTSGTTAPSSATTSAGATTPA